MSLKRVCNILKDPHGWLTLMQKKSGRHCNSLKSPFIPKLQMSVEDGDTHSGGWDQALRRQAALSEASGLNRESGEEGISTGKLGIDR